MPITRVFKYVGTHFKVAHGADFQMSDGLMCEIPGAKRMLWDEAMILISLFLFPLMGEKCKNISDLNF